ncbi:MAG: hypothetical protein QX196_08200 [Methylococcaceae bacterium]
MYIRRTHTNNSSTGERYYTYRLVVSRERSRQFNGDDATSLVTASDETVRCQKVVAEDGQEVRLYCHSSGREQKEQAMPERFASRFEAICAAR